MSSDQQFTLNGVSLIGEERVRQIRDEGYTQEGDADRADQLARAGACYADKVASDMSGSAIDEPHVFWPWDAADWKPADSDIDTLVKAGALIAAAIDAILWDIDGPNREAAATEAEAAADLPVVGEHSELEARDAD
jgi:hypothetical protein